MEISYYNGKITPYEDTLIPISDRAIFFGDGVYDAFIGRNKIVYLYDDHIARLYGNAEAIGIAPPTSADELKEIIAGLVDHYGNGCFFLYVQFSASGSRRAHTLRDGKTNLLITLTDQALPRPDGTLTVETAEDVRYGLCNIKTLNLLPNVLAAIDADSRGNKEAVFIRNGIVTECTRSNVAIIKGNRLITHPRDNRILPGIARSRLLINAEALGLVTEERSFSASELYEADAVLITSTTGICRRATEVDGKPFIYRIGDAADRLCTLLYQEFMESTVISDQ